MNENFKKWVFTFGIGSRFCKKCVIIETDDLNAAYEYMFDYYGQKNVAFSYLYEELGKDIIEKYHYEIIEEKRL